MKTLKITLTINIFILLALISTSFINGLGCNNTIKFWLPDLPFSIYSTCSFGEVHSIIKDSSSSTLMEIEGQLFSIGKIQLIYINEVSNINLNSIDQYPFKSNLLHSYFISSTIKRFNSDWIGIFSNYPINTAFIAEIEGDLNLQDRWNNNR